MLTDLTAVRLPDDVEPTLAVLDRLDELLVGGLARVSEAGEATLAELVDTFAASPLHDLVARAVDAIRSGTVHDDALLGLAASRTALLGAVHDAVLDQADAALGRTRTPWGSSIAEPPAANRTTHAAGAMAWLREAALVGWRGLTHDLVAGAAPAIERLVQEPSQRRLAVLLDGLAAELRFSVPVAGVPHLPVRRWADLWSRAVLLAQTVEPAAPAEPEQVSGRLVILGVEIAEHATAVQLRVHGLLETDAAAPQLVRTSVSILKVASIVGPAVWQLFGDIPKLRTALAEQRTVELVGVGLLPGGDLLWDETAAQLGAVADPFTVARIQLDGADAPATRPLDRHTTRIAEPVLLEHEALAALRLEVDRLPTATPLTAALVGSATACLGLLRWDAGRWTVQPLAVQTMIKKKSVAVHGGDWANGPTDPKIAKAIGDAVPVLTERAGKLLRG